MFRVLQAWYWAGAAGAVEVPSEAVALRLGAVPQALSGMIFRGLPPDGASLVRGEFGLIASLLLALQALRRDCF